MKGSEGRIDMVLYIRIRSKSSAIYIHIRKEDERRKAKEDEGKWRTDRHGVVHPDKIKVICCKVCI